MSTNQPIIKDTAEYVFVSPSGSVVRSFGLDMKAAQAYFSKLPSDTKIKLYFRTTTHIEVPREG